MESWRKLVMKKFGMEEADMNKWMEKDIEMLYREARKDLEVSDDG